MLGRARLHAQLRRSTIARTSLLQAHILSRPLATMDAKAKKQFLADAPPTVVKLEIKPHFEALSDKQKRYAHFISKASWAGTRIVLRQISPESEPIYDFILSLHKGCNGNWKLLGEKTGVSSEDVTTFLEYAAQFLGNNGNYKGFGDSKFIPRVAESELEKLASITSHAKSAYQEAKSAGGGLYETSNPEAMHLGYPDGGHMTTYYPDSPNMTKEEITLVSEFVEKKKLLPENTRIKKDSMGNFEVLIASGIANPPVHDRDLGEVEEWQLEGKLSGKTVKLVFGDYINEMAKIALNIKRASLNADNDRQKKMHEEYVKSFGTGSLLAYKEAQRLWVRDKGPIVETNIGFVETYRDPHGIRAEWEGFVAMVNQERTRAFGKLVSSAPELIPLLPWSKEFEKDTFLSPDFTSLEILAFAGSGIPSGINIPNYDDIRQTFGFKNVSLGNVLSAKPPNEPLPFIRDADQELYRQYKDSSWEVQVGLHELLGHGTGKLFQETSPGEYNFDVKDPPTNPLTNKPISCWYKPGQTWASIFGPIAGPYEECRAECVAMALTCEWHILDMFGFGNGQPDLSGEPGHVLYASYLSMARAGIVALEYWDPKTGKWGQAHMQARFSILRTFLEAGQDFIQLKTTTSPDSDELTDLEVHLDRNKILTVGRPAVEKYLQKLQVYKATADFDEGKKMFDDICRVDDWFAKQVRPFVLEKKTPRKIFVQPNTVMVGGDGADDGKVELREYEPSLEGMVQSFVERDV